MGAVRTFILFFLMSLSTNVIFAESDSIKVHKPFINKLFKNFNILFHNITDIDTNYIEPQHYNYTVMLQNTNTFEVYKFKRKDGAVFTFSPKPSCRIGPYIGWRWIFLGYTVDFAHLNEGSKRRELDLSIYSSLIGIDLFYRKMKNDYNIKSIFLGDSVNTKSLSNIPFDGLSSSIKGFNIYYIFNHRKFSYPAAFSQSTCQRRSRGSALLGIGYTKHSIDIDWSKLNTIVSEKLGHKIADNQMDSSLTYSNVQYTDISVSGGYAYNWVFARNCLFASSMSLALAYKHSTSDTQHNSDKFLFRDFSLSNFNFDAVGRFGIVWNNTKWYVGSSAIIHSYNYRKDQFSTLNFFMNLNVYVGFNFGK
jgi:hypothetical protein